MRSRKPLIAFLFSLVSVGLGQIYCGEPKKGFAFVLAQYLCLFALLVGFHSFPLLVVCTLAGLLIYLANLVNALQCASGKKEYQLAAYNRWYCYLLFVVVFSFVLPLSIDVKGSYVEAFKTPSSSMSPSLIVGDHFLVDKSWYRSHKPQRGDVVVFHSPNQPEVSVVKRVVGVAGDLVELKGKRFFRNGQEVSEPYAVYDSGGIMDFSPRIVSEGHIFVLGDNRDASKDSRHYVDNRNELQPFVPLESLKGKALYIYFSKEDLHRIGSDLNQGVSGSLG